VQSRLLPLALVTAALAAASGGLGGLALWLGLLAVPAAAALSFVAISDLLEGTTSRLNATTSTIALTFIVVGCAVRSNAAAGTAAPPFATWALVAALLAYTVPVFAWMLEPVKVTRTKPERRRRRRPRPAVELEPVEIFERAA
jgi:hypothetical protein